MVQILPLRDRARLEQLCRQEGVSARLAFCLYDAGEITGWILYDLTAQEGLIRAVHAPDEPSFDGLVRAVLASLDDAGILQARLAPGVDRNAAERLGLLAPGADTLSIRDILYRCGSCHGCGQPESTCQGD